MASHILLKGGTVFTGAEVIRHGFVEIESGRIGRVGAVADLTSDLGAEVVDTTGGTVLPGIIDTHAHVLHQPQLMGLSEGATAIWGARYLRSVLAAGITTVRDLGARTPAIFGLKHALANGYVRGPRLLAAGCAICMTGGHGWHELSIEADGPDEVAKVARQQLKAGADLIKLMATGGAGTPGQPGAAQLNRDEMHAAVLVAHAAGRPVAAHALGAQGIVNAIEAGVDTIEHAVFIDDRGIELLLANNVGLCPTLSVYPRIVERGEAAGEPSFMIDKARAIVAPHLQSITRAVAAGAKIVFGTDAATSYNPVGDFGLEMALMVRAGMSPAAVLRSATSVAAEICGIGHFTGSLRGGLEADVLVVDGDATTDISAATDVKMVFRAGELFLPDSL
jgi:imidazolonepropionase-like amidohydrolase